MKHYAVITADVIDSKHFPDFSGHLKSQLKLVVPPGLMMPFTVSRGDEMQAVTDDPSQIPVILRHLRYYVRPLKLRVGIGIGSIDSSARTNNSWDMTGPAFISARDAVESIKKYKTPKTIVCSDDIHLNRVFNTIYDLVDSLMTNWTEEQWQAVQTYEMAKTFVKAATTLQIARQNVQKRCQAARWDHIKMAEENLAIILNELSINTPSA